MSSDLTDQTETDILTLDISDDVLERAAAAADGPCISVGACTHWYFCSWPLSPAQQATSRRG